MEESLIEAWRLLAVEHPWLPFVKAPPGVFVTQDGRIGVLLRTSSSPTVSGDVPGSEFRSAPGVIAFGQMQHVAVTIDTVAGSLKAYLNGQEVYRTNMPSTTIDWAPGST